jgi:hypothetical protein
MRRLVLICMMLLLPVQWTWAAAASFCAHETGLASKHFGHHEHHHKAAAGDASKDGESSPAGLDMDCGYCHLSGSLWVASVQTQSMSLTETAPPTQDPPPRGSHLTSGPERPDRWLAA